MNEPPVLVVEGLTVRAADARHGEALVNELGFSIGTEKVALVGESGSGKSLTARALLGLLGPSLTVSARRLEFLGQDVRRLPAREWSRIRGPGIGLVLQDPRHALNPALRIGAQMDEALRLHARLPRRERRERMREALVEVGLDETRRVLDAYPRELSGGMGQRVMIAMMLINGPRLVVADEPTSALDAALRGQVLDLLDRLVEQRRMALLLISHDLPMVRRHADRVLVLYRGRLVDEQPAARLAMATHPYTRALWACRPSAATHGTRLPVYAPVEAGDAP